VAVTDEHMTIFPEPGEVKDVAKLLLALADHPGQVMSTLDPTIGFRVPAWLYESFVKVWDANLEAVAVEVVPDGDAVPEVVEVVKRKAGRPRKEVQ